MCQINIFGDIPTNKKPLSLNCTVNAFKSHYEYKPSTEQNKHCLTCKSVQSDKDKYNNKIYLCTQHYKLKFEVSQSRVCDVWSKK